jgi:hypothetical protein
MLTTAGDACLKSAMVDFSSGQSSPRGETARGTAFGSFNVALSTQGWRLNTNVSDAIEIAAPMGIQWESPALASFLCIVQSF